MDPVLRFVRDSLRSSGIWGRLYLANDDDSSNKSGWDNYDVALTRRAFPSPFKKARKL